MGFIYLVLTSSMTINIYSPLLNRNLTRTRASLLVPKRDIEYLCIYTITHLIRGLGSSVLYRTIGVEITQKNKENTIHTHLIRGLGSTVLYRTIGVAIKRLKSLFVLFTPFHARGASLFLYKKKETSPPPPFGKSVPKNKKGDSPPPLPSPTGEVGSIAYLVYKVSTRVVLIHEVTIYRAFEKWMPHTLVGIFTTHLSIFTTQSQYTNTLATH
jgi:hypothetical protein